MALSLTDARRNARLQELVTAAGANAKVKFYNGTRISANGAIAGQTLLATLNFATLGNVSGGVLTFGVATQNNANHVAGTATFAVITNAADAIQAVFGVGASGADLTMTGAIANGVDIAVGAITITDPNS